MTSTLVTGTGCHGVFDAPEVFPDGCSQTYAYFTRRSLIRAFLPVSLRR